MKIKGFLLALGIMLATSCSQLHRPLNKYIVECPGRQPEIVLAHHVSGNGNWSSSTQNIFEKKIKAGCGHQWQRVATFPVSCIVRYTPHNTYCP